MLSQTEAEKIRHFARYCWNRRNAATPSGKTTWGKRFEEISGMTLDEFAAPLIAEAKAAKEKAIAEARQILRGENSCT